MHRSGYRPGVDSLSSIMRRRYRFVSKIPSVAALPPDPSLWLVHYCQAEPQNCIPTTQVMVPPQVRSQLAERQWIERQGRLEQQAFMLHDREKWPHLSMPGQSGLPGPMYNPGMQGQNPMAHIGNPRFSGNFYQQQAAAQQAQAGPPPAKRARQHAPSQIPASAAALMATDTSIEDEENVLYGDILDHLTQREISLTRYTQHHEWMEEVFSSPYATGKIVPADLGFGLMGELAELTDGILDMPSGEEEKPLAKNAPQPLYKKISPEQLSEFEKRVKVHMDKGQAELERMKQEHAKKMASLKKSKTLVQAEKRLRNSVWDPADTGNEVWRLDRAAMTSGDAAAATPTQKESTEDVIKDVEAALGGSIKSQKEATLVDRGGLREKVAAPPLPPPQSANDAASNGQMSGDGSFDQYGQTTTGSEQQIQSEQHVPDQAIRPQQPQQQEQQQLQSQAQHQDQAHLQQPQQQSHQPPQQYNMSAPADASMDNSESMLDDPSMSLMEDLQMDMDVDVDMNSSALDFTNPEPSPAPQQPQQARPRTQVQDPSSSQQVNPAPTSTDLNQGNIGGTGTTEQDMFNSTSTPAGGDTTFNDFDAGDGFIDFDGGADDTGFGEMDNSAFGDAFQATEAHGGEGV